MKPNNKKQFDLKSFFILHIEKIAFIVIVPLAIFVAYKGTALKPPTWTPTDLEQAAANAKSHIEASDQRASHQGVELTNYQARATWIEYGIKEDLYLTSTPWMPSLFPQKLPRGSVELFTVEGLKAATGLGSITVGAPVEVLRQIRPDLAQRLEERSRTPTTTTSTNPYPSATNRNNTLKTGERWVVVTGLIPIEKQLARYVDALTRSSSPMPDRDAPLYYTYEVERAEVLPGTADLSWEKLDVDRQTREKIQLWGMARGAANDPVDPTYTAPMLNLPGALPLSYLLPPVDRKFGPEVAYPPEIPLLADSQTELMQKNEEQQRKMIDEYFAGARQPTTGQINPFAANRQGSSTGYGVGGNNSILRPDGSTNRNRNEADSLNRVVVKNYLYRFLDFNVEAGKTYTYRVRLALANPNYELGPNAVISEDLTKDSILYTEFSEPSNPVTVPMESRVLATKVNQRTEVSEPLASVLAIYFNMEDGTEWYTTVDNVRRGKTINLANREVVNAELEAIAKAEEARAASTAFTYGPNGQRIPGPRTTPSTRTTRQTADATEKEEEIKKRMDIISNVCVLDMQGGRVLGKTGKNAPDLTSPAKMLVMEPSGNLVIRNINTDLGEEGKVKNPLASNTSRSNSNAGMYSGGF